MRPFGKCMLALGASLFATTGGLAQTPFGHSFCVVYKQAAEKGAQALVDMRGTELAKDRWEAKDFSVPNGACIVRAVVEQAELFACTVRQENLDDAKSWATDMAKASRECLGELAGFAETTRTTEEDGAKVDITTWARKTDAGHLRVVVATVVAADGKALNRVQVRAARP